MHPAGYAWGSEKPSYAHGYLWPALQEILRSENGRSVFDLGCGNGGTASLLTSIGYDVVGVDPSTEGICHANRAYPTLRLEKGSGYDDLRSRYGQFPLVISLEVVEHVYDPRTFAKTLFDLVAPGGLAIVSTPYHGYLKNIALPFPARWTRTSPLYGTTGISNSGPFGLSRPCSERLALPR